MAINEAVELAKKYDDPKARSFINGVLNAIKKELEDNGGVLPVIDALLGRHAKGWRTDRLSRVSRAILRLGAYEVVFAEKIPAPVAINEAVELAKKYDEPKARPFINCVLNAIKK